MLSENMRPKATNYYTKRRIDSPIYGLNNYNTSPPYTKRAELTVYSFIRKHHFQLFPNTP